MPDVGLVRAHIERLQAEVKHHKAELGRHRRQLQVAASSLTQLQAMLKRMTSPIPEGVEGKDLHGRTDDTRPNPQP